MESVIEQVIFDLYGVKERLELAIPDEKFGDYSTNVALRLARSLNQPPRQIAETIVEHLSSLDGVEKVEIAGPGFINLTLTDEALLDEIRREISRFMLGKKVLVEYSDPNPLKPLHAGHLYTTLVGDSIARLMELAGADVVRLNYGGDVGLHIAKSMWSIIRQLGGERPDKLAEVAEIDRPTWLGARYVEGNNAYEDDGAAKSEIVSINKKVYQLYAEKDRQSDFAKIYWTVRQWSYDHFDELYKNLGVKPFDRYIPESEVASIGTEAVKDGLETGDYEESDGAIVFKGEKVGLHTRVFINSEGLPTYEAKDVGLILTKWRDYHFDKSIVITGSEQAQYMAVMLASVQQFEPLPVERTTHLTHGMIKLLGGQKMSSRAGNIVGAMDIIDSARLALEASGRELDNSVVLAAIKYAFSKVRIGGDIIYSPEESIALEGSSGPYLQYAHARASSILRKSGKTSILPKQLDSDERRLVRKLSHFQGVVEVAAAELAPHLVAKYIYELAQSFNGFYERSQVIGDKREPERLWLIEKYVETLKVGLDLLGIVAPDSM